MTDAGDPELGPLRPDEHRQLFDLFAAIVDAGEGYPHAAPLTPEGFATTWTAPGVSTVVARVPAGGGTAVVGASYLKPNFVGRAAHIANAGYLVAASHRRRGIGRALVLDSLRRAAALGFDAIMFNLVFVSNPARTLYEALGWREIGRIPDAVDGEAAVVYWRAVGEPAP